MSSNSSQPISTTRTGTVDLAKKFRRTAVVLQYISYGVTRSYFFISRSKIERHFETLDTSKTYVLASNHTTWSDPWLCTTALGKHLFDLLPCRFIAYNLFIKRFGFFILPLGAYPAKPHPKYIHGLEASLYMNNAGQTVVIFPQGKRSNNINVPEPKRGVAVLASEPNTLVIPIRLRPKRRFGYDIVVGEPFDGSGKSAKQIMKRIYDL